MRLTSKVQRYLLAIVSTGAATGLSWVSEAPSSCFHLSIIVSSLYGGEGAGLLSVALSILVFDYFFLPPRFHLSVEPSAYLRFAGFIVTALCINRLIAAKQRVERSRREAEDQYRIIAETALDAIISADEQGQVVLVNSAATRIFGYSASELIGQPLTKILPRFHYDGRSTVTEQVGVRKDGRSFSAEVSFDEVVVGKRRGLAGFVRDITERKRAEDALRRSESYLTQAQRLSLTGSFGWNIARKEVYWSEQMFHIAGIDPGTNLTLEMIFDRIHPEDRDSIRRVLEDTSKRGADLEFEHRFVMPDGSIKTVHVLGRPVRDESGDVEYIGSAMDITASRRTEEELRRSEEKYRELVDLSPDAIYLVDFDGVLVSSNPAGLKMLRCTAEEARGLRIVKTHLPEDQEAHRARLEELRRGASFRFERIFVRMDGTQVPVEVSVSPVRQGYSQGVIRDISERKQNELELRRSAAYLAEAERISHTGCWVLNPRLGKSVYWSPETYRIYERDPRLGPRPLIEQRDFYSPEDWAVLTSAVEKSIKDKVDLDFEARMIFPDGLIKYIRAVGHPVVDASGEVIEIVGSTRDITEQHQARASLQNAFAELKKSEDQLRTIIDTIPALAWRTDADGSSEFLNKRWHKYTGLSDEQALNGGWMSAYHPEDVSRLMKAWRAALASGIPGEVEGRIRRFDGEYRWFLIRTRPSRDELGNVVNWYGTCTDIEDLRNTQEALRRTEARLARAAKIATVGELSASIAHEINQPLTAVITNAHACLQWLSGENANVASARRTVERIIQNGNDAAEVVKRVRALFQRGALEKVALDMNEVIGEVLKLLRGETVRKDVAVETAFEKDLPPVLGDRIQMQQVLVNLCLNGIEAMDTVSDRPKKLFIRSAMQGSDAVQIEIQDHGVGLQQEDKIFEAFFTTKANGMGMGLSISRSIIESHDGRLWPVYGKGPGTTFCFTIPVKPK
jgi:PAS domain S-box-containing protein